jgi:hypothetical protein
MAFEPIAVNWDIQSGAFYIESWCRQGPDLLQMHQAPLRGEGIQAEVKNKNKPPITGNGKHL